MIDGGIYNIFRVEGQGKKMKINIISTSRILSKSRKLNISRFVHYCCSTDILGSRNLSQMPLLYVLRYYIALLPLYHHITVVL